MYDARLYNELLFMHLNKCIHRIQFLLGTITYLQTTINNRQHKNPVTQRLNILTQLESQKTYSGFMQQLQTLNLLSFDSSYYPNPVDDHPCTHQSVWHLVTALDHLSPFSSPAQLLHLQRHDLGSPLLPFLAVIVASVYSGLAS